jgi:hypothetical protein
LSRTANGTTCTKVSFYKKKIMLKGSPSDQDLPSNSTLYLRIANGST